MKVFLDTNVLLDWLLDRQHTFSEEATTIIRMAETKAIDVSISGGSLYTVAYVLEKSGLRDKELKTNVLRILKLVSIVPDSNTIYANACLNSFKDLEDAFQYEIAKSDKKTDFFITGSLKHYTPYELKQLPVVSPSGFLNIIGI